MSITLLAVAEKCVQLCHITNGQSEPHSVNICHARSTIREARESADFRKWPTFEWLTRETALEFQYLTVAGDDFAVDTDDLPGKVERHQQVNQSRQPFA